MNDDLVGMHLITEVPMIYKNYTVKKVLFLFEEKSHIFEAVDYIYVIDKDKTLIGVCHIKDIFKNKKSRKVKDFMNTNIVSVTKETSLEKITQIALNNNLKQIPVISSKKLIGVVPAREILTTINESLKEHIFQSAGIDEEHLEYESSLNMPFLKSIENRSSWLLAGLIGAIFMALYIGLFEETLSKYLIIAAFVPALVYMSGALTTQFQTIFVRDLAILGNKLNIKTYFLRQMLIGLVLSFIISVVMLCFIILIWKELKISYIISLATFITLLTSTFNSLVITLLIKKFKFDPAFGSGPMSTIISDITSVIIYFIIVILLI